MICKHCGTKLPDDSLFCTECGERVDIVESPVSENFEEEKVVNANENSLENERAIVDDTVNENVETYSPNIGTKYSKVISIDEYEKTQENTNSNGEPFSDYSRNATSNSNSGFHGSTTNTVLPEKKATFGLVKAIISVALGYVAIQILSSSLKIFSSLSDIMLYITTWVGAGLITENDLRVGGIFMLIIALPVMIISLIFGIKSIKKAKKGFAAGGKPIATLILGISACAMFSVACFMIVGIIPLMVIR